MKTSVIKNASLTFLLIVTVFAFNCCTDKVTDIDPQPVSTAGQFLNLNTGSTWEYTTDGSANTSVVKITDSTKSAFSKNYKIFHSTKSGATSRLFYTYKDGNYYILVPTTTTDYEELVYLKDSTEVGKKWTTSVTSSGVPVIHNYEVKENGLTKTVNGTNFTNVVHVKLNIPVSGYTADAYYAPKIGLIKSDEVVSSITYITELKSYTLK